MQGVKSVSTQDTWQACTMATRSRNQLEWNDLSDIIINQGLHLHGFAQEEIVNFCD